MSLAVRKLRGAQRIGAVRRELYELRDAALDIAEFVEPSLFFHPWRRYEERWDLAVRDAQAWNSTRQTVNQIVRELYERYEVFLRVRGGWGYDGDTPKLYRTSRVEAKARVGRRRRGGPAQYRKW